LIRKEKEKSDSLRVHDFDGANRLQGILDGLQLCINEVERNIEDKVTEEDPYN